MIIKDKNKQALWKTLKEIIKTDKKTQGDSGDIIFPCSYTSTVQDNFNNYFVTSISEVINSIEITDSAVDYEVITKTTSCSKKFTDFKPVTSIQLAKVVMNLKNKKGTSEGISSEVLKNTLKSVGLAMMTAINLSLLLVFSQRNLN